MQVVEPRPRDRALEHIMAYILTNHLKAGDKLPTEREMCQMWGINRCTLRSAIAVLEEQGTLHAIHGSCTCVAPRFRRTLQDLQSFSEYASDNGLCLETQLLSMSVVECDKQLSKRLHLTLGKKVWRISRLRILSRQPVLIENAYIPKELAPELDQHDLIKESLFSVLQNVYGIELHHGEEKTSITTATAEEAQYLQIRSGSPIFWIVNVTESPDGTPVEYCRTVARADMLELASTLYWQGDEVPGNG